MIAPVVALVLAVPAFIMSSNLTDDSDKPKKIRSKKKTVKKQKQKEQDKRRMLSHANVLQVKSLAERLLEEVKQQERSGSSDSELISIRTEVDEIIAEVQELK
jgi:hypothetical protein